MDDKVFSDCGLCTYTEDGSRHSHVHPVNAIPASPDRVFYVGQSHVGHWVVKDSDGSRGGVFIGKSEAFKFALFENGGRRESVVFLYEKLELDPA